MQRCFGDGSDDERREQLNVRPTNHGEIIFHLLGESSIRSCNSISEINVRPSLEEKTLGVGVLETEVEVPTNALTKPLTTGIAAGRDGGELIGEFFVKVA